MWCVGEPASAGSFLPFALRSNSTGKKTSVKVSLRHASRDLDREVLSPNTAPLNKARGRKSKSIFCLTRTDLLMEGLAAARAIALNAGNVSEACSGIMHVPHE